MKALSILYHDVIDGHDFDSSGFPGPAAARYKLSLGDFEKHLEAISRVLNAPPMTIFELSETSAPRPNLLFTFDDGGTSAQRIAKMLDQRNWRAHFFITTDYIGQPGFMSAGQIRELKQQGHVIGSHSCSHPRRMSSCSSEEVLNEWRRSTEVLTELTGDLVTIASVPRGNYSTKVAQAARQAGIKFLFTSEPTSRCHVVDGCWILGRYGIMCGTSAARAADFAMGKFLPCFKQWAAWNLKKALKSVGGNCYHRVRDLSLGEDRTSASTIKPH